MSPARLRVILNPRSGRLLHLPRLLTALRTLEQRGWQVERFRTAAPMDAMRLAEGAAAAGCDVVLACGGDGTINEVVNGLAGSSTALAVLPAGTVNLWAREAALGSNPEAAVALVAGGERRRVDLGRVNGRYFLLLTSIGADSVAMRDVTPELKRRFGRSAYFIAGARELIRNGGASLRIESEGDGATITGRFVALIVGNTRLYGGMLNATAMARVDDGLLDLVAYRGESWPHLIPHAARTLTGRHIQAPTVVYRQSTRFRIVSERPLPVQADGEYVGETPVEIDVAPSFLTVVVPPGLDSVLFTSSSAGGWIAGADQPRD